MYEGEIVMEQVKALRIKIKPYLNESYDFQYADVKMKLENPQLSAGDKLCDLWKMVAGVPGAELSEEGVKAADAKGTLPLTMTIEKDPTGFPKRVWKPERETEGDVTFSYRFFPRDVTGVDRCHPYFDVVTEKNGALLPGVTTLAAVPEGQYHIFISWDKSAMPEEAKVVSIKGCGDFDYVGTPQDYTFTLYQVGKIHRTDDASGKRHIYWLDDYLPDNEKVISQLPALLQEICTFFGDEQLEYSIFFRKEPFRYSNGGTAFDGGFVFGYSDEMPLDMEAGLNTLAHETVHNWPALDQIEDGGSWYSEGTAEFYSLMIPLRAGIASPAQAAEWITEKCTNYYNNPYQNLTNQEAYDRAWEDIVLQKVPYGRGFVYLAETDYLLRKNSGGAKSLDDLVLTFVSWRREGKKVTDADWEALIEKELGSDAVTHFRGVMSGKETIPVDDAWFGGAFTFAKGTYSDVKKGVIEDALIWRPKEEK